MQNFRVWATFTPPFEVKQQFFYGPSITHKDDHFATTTKTALKLDEKFKQEMCASQNTPVYINYQTV